MAVVEPTAAEAKTLGDLASLFAWAGVPGNVRHPGTAAGALVKLLEFVVPADDASPTAAAAQTLGLTAALSGNTIELLQWQLLVQLANIDAAEFKECINDEWRYCKDVPADSADDPNWIDTCESRPSLPMKGAANSALRAAKIRQRQVWAIW